MTRDGLNLQVPAAISLYLSIPFPLKPDTLEHFANYDLMLPFLFEYICVDNPFQFTIRIKTQR